MLFSTRMSIVWWRTRVFVFYFASRLSAFHMSSASLSGNDQKASDDISDSPEAPNIKKVKLDQQDSADKPWKDIPRSSVPSTAFLSKPTLTQKSVNIPASAFKIGSTSVNPSSIIESFDMESEDQRYQTQNKDGPNESELQEMQSQNKADQEDRDSETKILEDVVLASSPDSLKAEEGKEGSGDEALVDSTTMVTVGSQDLDVHTSFQASSDDNIDAMDSQEEGDTQTKNSSGCDAWEQLPFFAESEMDQSDEVDGNSNSSAATKVTKIHNQATVKDSEDEVTHKKKRGRTKSKNPADKETKPKKPPPNAFVAVRIPSPGISAKFEEVQRALQEKDERLKQIFVPAAKNHITLMVMRLNNQEDTEKAKLALLEATEKVKTELDLLNDPLELNFGGLGNFSKNVLFAKVAEGPSRERLIAMAGIVESVFVSKDLSSSSTTNFSPHLTIAKMSKKPRPRAYYGRRHKKHHKKSKAKGGGESKDNELRGIDHSVYAELLETEFGRQIIEGLELLSMTHPAAEDGYYHCYQRHSFATSEGEP